ncbi:hypothetical protein QVD17_15961 [Tagetes erecta]|uniref:Transmembrane protein n=1 Tax=Tagetes erecta TaxID=13708 RepID=A0AAD8NZ61_TARER|nr:hypothetical protein QVD17_15961 [Tagetes erecta]
MILETHLLFVGRLMYLYTGDRRMFYARTVILTLLFLTKASFVLFVILRWLDQMLRAYCVLQHRSDDSKSFLLQFKGVKWKNFDWEPMLGGRSTTLDCKLDLVMDLASEQRYFSIIFVF